MPRGSVVRGARPEALAGALAMVTYCLGQALAGRLPFGAATRNVNDYGTQLVPQYAHLRDVLTGQADGDLWFSWSSALGVPYVGDLGAYVSSPLSVLVVAFPRDEVDLAAFVVHQLHLALAAAAMTAYLRRTGAGSWLVATALGAAYATCGWAVDDAAFFTTWLTGLIGLPVLALVGEWAVRGRRPVLGPVLVALVWVANFYSAYMATIGAALLVLCRLVALGADRRLVLLTVVRGARAVGLGLALAAPLLVPLFLAIRAAQPSGSAHITRVDLTIVQSPAVGDLASRVLPATVGVGVSPALYVTTPVVLLALVLLWHTGVARRARLAHALGLAAVLLSMLWVPTQVAWHGFDVPDGSHFREAFVVCGWLTVMAWRAVERTWPGALAWVGGLASLVVLWAVGSRSEHTSRWTTSLLVMALVAVLGAVLVPGALSGGRTWAARALGAVMVAVVLLEGSVTAMVVGEHHHDRFTKRPPWTRQQAQIRSTLQDADEWPGMRTTPGTGGTPGVRKWATPNDPMLVGGQGLGYYSSLMPRTTTEALQSVGVTYLSYGRSIIDTPDPPRDALLGIGQRVEAEGPPITRAPSAPLVSARPEPALSDDVFGTRNALAAAEVWTFPALAVESPDGVPLVAGAHGGYDVPASPEAPAAVLRATCPEGSRVHLSAPETAGWAQTAEGVVAEIVPIAGGRMGHYRGGGPVDLGPAPSGEARVDVFGSPQVVLPARPLACFDPQAMDEAIRTLQQTAADVTTGGHSFAARWDAGVDGTAVALVTATEGWRCSTGGPWRAPDPAAGFITVDMAGSDRLDCTFRPPGTEHGAAIGLLTLVALLAPSGLRHVRSRRGASDGDRLAEVA